jgi:hypothetical protein
VPSRSPGRAFVGTSDGRRRHLGGRSLPGLLPLGAHSKQF